MTFVFTCFIILRRGDEMLKGLAYGDYEWILVIYMVSVIGTFPL